MSNVPMNRIAPQNKSCIEKACGLEKNRLPNNCVQIRLCELYATIPKTHSKISFSNNIAIHSSSIIIFFLTKLVYAGTHPLTGSNNRLDNYEA